MEMKILVEIFRAKGRPDTKIADLLTPSATIWELIMVDVFLS
ncbi:hypothetical protein AXFE_11830 [Acidithrix ferrooxidans]|uniref:Uncharacterized protein n=1 Tax=Acidithrix ferrooxidans TaxID=1280514 RepID=A0A0D8HLF2_9ACTN|nr:hypothetical protein AXFE_11830 [Acidithrix ferrooxidans]